MTSPIGSEDPSSPLRQEIVALIQQLAERDTQVRRRTSARLSEIGEPAISFLIQALHDAERWYGAVETLVHIGPPAVEPLIRVLNEETIDAFAFDALSQIGQPAVGALIDTLQSASPVMRRWAAQALGWIGDQRAVAPLTAALTDPDDAVRQCAQEALTKMEQ